MSIELNSERLNIIVAFTDKNKFIAQDNELPWGRLASDFAFLRYMMNKGRMDGVLIMGRKTAEIAKFAGFEKIILTRQDKENSTGVSYVKTFDEAMKMPEGKIRIVLGGESVYKMALEHTYSLFCTIVEEQEMVGNIRFSIDDNKTFESNRIDITSEIAESIAIDGMKWEFDEQNNVVRESGRTMKFYYYENK